MLIPLTAGQQLARLCRDCHASLQKRRDAQGVEVLSPLDKLFVVHVYKEGKKEKEKDGGRWAGGGPLLPAMRTALAKFPHQVVELEVRRQLSCQALHAIMMCMQHGAHLLAWSLE